ncbi:hypothetical protein L7F22_038580 [Adiantum nelumboides]|nr:hypothetical protein [Adiantum nelumboides]MCO5584649.1 hypothetical protein [Adiantum nelumboides]
MSLRQHTIWMPFHLILASCNKVFIASRSHLLQHGYASDTSWLFQSIPITFVQWGYAAFAADLLGHGECGGLPGYIEDIQTTASVALFFYKSVHDWPEHSHLKKFLFGESTGGGLTFLMLLQDPHGWDGAIFSAPFSTVRTMLGRPTFASLHMASS